MYIRLQRTRPVTTPFERRYCFESGLRRGPCDAVHAGSPFALILSHPSDGECLAAERVGQQPLQGFHLAVFALLCRLHDTRLQPSNLAITTGPVDAVPMRRAIGGRTGAGLLHCHLPLLL